MSSASTNTVEESFSQSFAMQFISLMLFILIFVVTAFLPKNQTESKNIPPAADNAPIKSVHLEPRSQDIEHVILSRKLTPEFFVDNNSSNLNLEAWQGIMQTLFSHDLSLVISVPIVDGVSAALYQANEIKKQLLLAGIPPQALIVQFARSSTTEDVELSLISGDVAW